MKFLPALFLLFALPVFAVDYHVLEDTDHDGFANPCPNANHRSVYSTDTLSCGGTVDIDGDGAVETVYCTLQAAFDVATGQGASVEVHTGAWDRDQDNNGSADALRQKNRAGYLCTGGTGEVDAMVYVPPCPTCTQESHRRYFRAAWIDGNTNGVIDSGEQDTGVVISAPVSGGATPAGIAILVCDESGGVQENCDYTTIDGFEITGLDGSEWNGRECGFVYVAGDFDYGHITNLYMHDIDTAGYDKYDASIALRSGITSSLGYYFDNVIVANNTINVTGGLLSMSGGNCCPDGGGTPGQCYAAIECDIAACRFYRNIFIYNNDVTYGADIVPNYSDRSAYYAKNSGPVVVWHNRFTCGTQFPGCGTFLVREVSDNYYLFNNYWHDIYRAHFWQVTCGKWTEINNTYYTLGQEVLASNNDTGELRFQNNIYAGTPSKISDCGTAMGGSTWYSGERFVVSPNLWSVSNSSFLSSACTGETDTGGHVCTDSQVCGANSVYTDCNSGTGGCAPLTGLFTASGDKPVPYYRLGSSSNAIGNASSDPDGDGVRGFKIDLGSDGVPDVDCHPPAGWPGPGISAAPSLHMTCDYDGDERGAVWDMGADEYGSAVCGNGNIEAGEDCDGSQHGGATCISLGFAGGTLSCDGECNFVTINCTPVASTSNLSLSGVTIRGGSIK